MYFEIIGEITNVETIAVDNAIRDIVHLRKQYGQGRWRKLKGIAAVRLAGGRIRRAEIHWYEAHGIGKKKFKIKLGAEFVEPKFTGMKHMALARRNSRSNGIWTKMR